MRVVASKVGYFNDTLHQPGAEFEVPEGTKGSWFEPVEQERKPRQRAEKHGDKDGSDLA